MKRLAILGSTGSIGQSTLAVVAEHPEEFSIVSLAAGKNVALLAEQIKRFKPALVSVQDEAAAAQLQAGSQHGHQQLAREDGGRDPPGDPASVGEARMTVLLCLRYPAASMRTVKVPLASVSVAKAPSESVE